MSNEVAIHVENLSKAYRIGLKEQRHETMLGAVTSWLKSPLSNFRDLRKLSRFDDLGTQGPRDPGTQGPRDPGTQGPRVPESQSPSDVIWALKDISFEVKHGEAIGIIGRNGAGKSTLLKILSRITEPTRGRAEVFGRVGSLLEVGTGFHPNLTGRENIYLNGTILGMKKREVDAKFDEIVEFSGVEKFIDTPVKRYSSGMRIRLGFSVAAHLEPEILIIDEVLAVGDLSFQKKCLGKMGDVARSGRTVLFVSHNMAAIKAFCTRGILLKGGAIDRIGAAGAVVGEYLREAITGSTERIWPSVETAPGNDTVRLLRVCVRPPDGAPAVTIDSGAFIEVGFYCAKPGLNLDCTAYLVNGEGIMLFESGCEVSSSEDSRVGTYRVMAAIPPHLLNAGSYYVNILFGQDQKQVLFKMEEAVAFEVENTATGRGANMAVAPGVVRPLLDWQFEYSGGDT